MFGRKREPPSPPCSVRDCPEPATAVVRHTLHFRPASDADTTMMMPLDIPMCPGHADRFRNGFGGIEDWVSYPSAVIQEVLAAQGLTLIS